MQLTEEVIDTISNRAAVLLAEWIGLSPLAKSKNGDDSRNGGMAMMLGAMLAAEAPPPPADATARMAAHIKAKISAAVAKRAGDVWMTFDVDYGPGRELSELSGACEIRSSWPIKSCLNITIYRSEISICDRRGYGDEGLTHYLIDGRGWLVSPCNIDGRLLPIVVAAVDGGSLALDLGRIEKA